MQLFTLRLGSQSNKLVRNDCAAHKIPIRYAGARATVRLGQRVFTSEKILCIPFVLNR